MLKYKIVKKTNKIETKDKYPDGANSPTVVQTYECFCGKGKIIDENVIGFNDRTITLKCEHCQKEYRSYIYLSGNDWKVYLQNN